MRKILPTILLLLFSFVIQAQGKFQFLGKKNRKTEVKFKLVNNLIIIPLEINGKKLSFILDTGVEKTILFNLSNKDSLGLNNVGKILIRGLGKGKPIEALVSKGNKFKIKGIEAKSKELYVIIKDNFNISAKMGETIHGVIGYDLLKDLIVKIDYLNRKLTLINPIYYKNINKCKGCERFDLEFYKNKPYLNLLTKLDTIEDNFIKIKMLIDTGGSDAVWLFENSKKEIQTPIRSFKDILGEGFSGTIYGMRSRIPSLKLGSFMIEEPTVSFLDSITTKNARIFKERNGSIGGEILSRFVLWIDYPNREIHFKKKKSLKGFYYNMSGIQLIYDGLELIKEKGNTVLENNSNNSLNNNSINTISFLNTFYYKFKPKYKIFKIVENSPASKVGLEEGDVIKYLNGRPAHTYSLGQILQLFQSKPNRKIKLKVLRGVTELKFEFRLEPRI